MKQAGLAAGRVVVHRFAWRLARLEVAAQRLPQRVPPDGLGQIVVAAGSQATLAIARHGVRGQGHDRPCPARLAEPRGRFQAVQSGHLHIHQDQIVRTPLGCRRPGQFTGRVALVGHIHLDPGAGQDHPQQFLGIQGVLRQQDSPLEGLLLRPGGGWPVGLRRGDGFDQSGLFGGRERQGEGERASQAGLADDVDTAAEERGQALADRQAQTAAAETPRVGRIGLGKGLEQDGQVGGGDADPCIRNGKAQLGRLTGGIVHLDPHAARLGEFQGITHQVHQDLPQPRRIGVHQRGQWVQVLGHQRQLLLFGPCAQQAQDLVDNLDGRTSQAFDLQLARFDLGEVEDVVQQSQQGVAIPLDDRLVAAAFVARQVCPLEQFAVAQDRGHGGPDFVAHVGQEFALDPVGRFGGVFGLP